MAKNVRKRATPVAINNAIIVSDTHCGCRLGLCRPEGIELDDGGSYKPSKFQLGVWAWWEEFWNEWVPIVTKGEPYYLIHNGDVVDGVHHNSTTQISHNLEDQGRLAEEIMRERVGAPNVAGYYHIRGTEAHVAKSGREEERVARALGAVKDGEGRYARYDLNKKIGPASDTRIINCLHHIGTTSSMAYESTALMGEYTSICAESGRNRRPPPDVVVRSHRHRNLKLEVPTARHTGIVIVTPGWQGKTPFAWKIAGARNTSPQFGGVLVRYGELGRLYVDSFVKTLAPTEAE